jgi:AhpD family alkylhydroperoxidase
MRLDFAEIAGDATKALEQLSASVQRSPLDRGLRELVAVYVSIINNCAHCIEMHWKKAVVVKVPEDKLRLLPAYAESGRFSEAELVSLDLADELTRLEPGAVDDELWQRALDQLGDEKTLMYLVYDIILMNAWNRLSNAVRIKPE